MVWQRVGHLCDATILVLMLHLAIGDTWNTVNNVEKGLGAAVPRVLCVWGSAVLASYAYYQVEPFAGQLLLLAAQLLLPTCLPAPGGRSLGDGHLEGEQLECSCQSEALETHPSDPTPTE